MELGEDGDEGEEEGGPKSEVVLLLCFLLRTYVGFAFLGCYLFFQNG